MIKSLTPMLRTASIEKTVAFYRDRLGFTVDTIEPEDEPTFCSLDHGDVHLMFYADPAPCDGAEEPSLTGHLYLYVDDVTALYERLEGEVDVLWGPEVYAYGMREFAIRDPNGYALAFGQPTDAEPTCRAETAAAVRG